MNPLQHERTATELTAFAGAPSQALLLVGAPGSGKLFLATVLTERLLGISAGGFATHPYVLHVSPVDGKAIGIDAVREISRFLSLKVPGHALLNRLVIIENSHTLTIEAQNALLKLLEEPAEGTVIIMTASHAQALLPTVRSRVQTINVRAPSREAVLRHFADLGQASSDIERAWALSGGLPGLMQALLSNTEHPLRDATETARGFLGSPLYGRLLMVDELSKDRARAQNVLFILQQMAHVGLQKAQQQKTAAKWLKIERASFEADEALRNNAQSKLVMSNLAFSV